MDTVFFWASKLISPFIAPLGALLLASAILLWISRPWQKQKSSRVIRTPGSMAQGLHAGAGKATDVDSPAGLVPPDRVVPQAASRKSPVWAAALGVWLLAWLFSSPGFSQALVSWWEFPLSMVDPDSLKSSQDAIVVLGGSVMPDPVIQFTQAAQAGLAPDSAPASLAWDNAPSSLAGKDIRIQVNRTAERLFEAARLWKAGVASLVIVSGGSGDLYNPDAREAPLMAGLLESMGVAPRAIIQESQSRNTRENIVNVKSILEQKGMRRIIIVSSALHLPRVELICRKVLGPPGQEWDWKLWSCDTDAFQTGFPEAIMPSAYALEDSTRVLREASGTLAYRIMGYL